MPNTAPEAAPVEVPEGARRQYDGLFDGLTRLPGWVLLLDRTNIALARSRRRDLRVGLIIFDDVRGVATISPDFATFVSLLCKRVRSDDTVARIAGCTFAVVLNDISDRNMASRIAQRLIWDAAITCRLGIAFDEPTDDAAALIDRALQAAASLT